MKKGYLPTFAAPGIVVLLALAVYANTFPGSYILDDVWIVRDNPLVAELDLKAIFTSDYWGTLENSGLYRPLTILSHALVQTLFGPTIFFHHLTNVLLHCAVSLLLYLTLTALPPLRHVALLAGAIFAVHPVHGEVVNVVVGRSELLAALFVFLGLWTALKRRPLHRRLTCACFAAALLSKESALTFLPLLFAVDAFAAGSVAKRVKERWRLYLGLVGVALVWLFLRTWILSRSPMPPDITYAADNPLIGLSALPRMLSAVKLQMLYLRTLVFPYPLLPVYSGNTVPVIERLFSLWGLAAAAFATALASLIVIGWKRQREYALGLVMYLAAFLVTANLLILLQVVMAERLAYLPSAGFSLAAAALLLPGASAPGEQRWRLPALAPGLVCLMVLATLTIARNPEFADPVRLWEATVRKEPASVRGWHHLAAEHARSGRIKEAEAAYRRAIEADPAFPDSYAEYALLLLKADRPAEALEMAMQKVRLLPNGISSAHLHVALAHLRLGDPETALEWLAKTERFYANTVAYQKIRALSLDALGDEQEAMAIYQVIYRHLDEPEIPHRLAVMLMNAVMFREAETVLRDFLGKGELADTYNLLGVALSLQRRLEETVEAFERAVALEPSNRMYRENLERARRIAASGQ